MKGFLLLLATVAMLATSSSRGQFSDPINNFFHWSPGIPQKYGHHSQVDYFLVDSAQELKTMAQRCIKAGMVLYGYSAFWSRGGEPQKTEATIYGQEIGAACVIYLAENAIQNGEPGTNHTIYFYGLPPTNGRKR